MTHHYDILPAEQIRCGAYLRGTQGIHVLGVGECFYLGSGGRGVDVRGGGVDVGGGGVDVGGGRVDVGVR